MHPHVKALSKIQARLRLQSVGHAIIYPEEFAAIVAELLRLQSGMHEQSQIMAAQVDKIDDLQLVIKNPVRKRREM